MEQKAWFIIRRPSAGERTAMPTGAFAKAALKRDSLSMSWFSASLRSVMSRVTESRQVSPSISMSLRRHHAREDAPVLAPELGLEALHLAALLERRHQPVPVLRADPDAQVAGQGGAADHVLARIARHHGEALVDVDIGPVRRAG